MDPNRHKATEDAGRLIAVTTLGAALLAFILAEGLFDIRKDRIPLLQ